MTLLVLVGFVKESIPPFDFFPFFCFALSPPPVPGSAPVGGSGALEGSVELGEGGCRRDVAADSFVSLEAGGCELASSLSREGCADTNEPIRSQSSDRREGLASALVSRTASVLTVGTFTFSCFQVAFLIFSWVSDVDHSRVE